MSVKEKAKAFEDRRSVVGESSPPRKKSREELIENKDDGDILGERHTTGPPVPPPRKYKKNGATRPNENSSPSTERKENMKPELNTTKPTSQSDSTTGRKPPRPPPPPRGSSLGRKSILLSNAESSPSVEKKIKPPVPPKPKNYVPKKVSSLKAAHLKSDNNSMSQPVKEKGDSAAPASSTASDKHKSQFFLALEKGNYTVAPSIGHDSSITSSNFFVSPEEKTSGLKSKEMESKQEVLSVSDNGINNVRNGLTDISMHENEVASQHGKTISSGKITSGKNMPDPLEGLEITVDEFSDEDGNLSPVVLEGEKVNDDFADLVEVNGITGSPTEHGKENVKILYSVQLEEECSVTRIDDSAKRQELDDVSLNRTADVFEAEEINKSHISMDGKFAEGREETADEKSHDEESYNSEPLTQDSSEEEQKREGINDSNVNQRMEKIAQITLEKPTEDEEMCDLDILDDLSEDSDQNILEGNTSIEEFYKTTMDDDVEVETDLQLGDMDSQQVEPMEESKKDVDIVTESQEDETQENSTVLLAEAIREGALISVTDHVVSEGSTEVVEEEGNEVLTNENPEELEDELVKEELEITASFSKNEQVVQNTDSENSVDNFRNETEGQFPSDVAMTFSEEVESENAILSELSEEREEEKSDENLVEDLVSEDAGKEEDTVQITETFCSSGNGEQVEEDSEGQASIAEPTEETSKEVVECIVNAVAVSTEDEAKVDNVVAPSVNEPALKEDENAEEAHSPTSPQPVRPERRSRQTRQQKNVYENVDTTKKHPLELIKSGTAVRKTQSFSKYETVVLSLPRPVQRVSDDEAIYRVPRVIPVESHANDDSEYSVPCQVSSRRIVQANDYAVPKPIVVQACAVRDMSKSNEGDVYSVPGQVTAVPVVETFAEPSSNELVQSVSKEGDHMYAVPVQEQLKSVSVVPVPIEEAQEKTVTVFPVPAEEAQKRKGTPPPKPPRWSLTKDEMKIKVELGDVPSSASAETTARESPKPVPRTREQRNSPSPVPRKSSKTAESSESATPPKSESPIPAPRSRLNALQSSTSSNVSSSEHSTLSSSEVSTQESTEEESTIKRRPPRPPPPSVRVSLLDSDSMPPPDTPGPFGHDLDSDSDSDVGEESPSKGPSKPKTYFIAHEILTTERTFVDALKLVFEECYGTIKNANVIADAVLGDIFRDLENIYLLDSKFLQELEERMETWEEHERIGDIIKKYGHFLKMYTQYVNGYDKAMSVFQDTMKENLEFANLVSQFQASERCHGMILSAYMLKPVQRIPSYRLLLIDYLKHLPKDSEESKDTEITLKIVSEVATHINESMKKMDSFEQMLKLQRMLVGQPEIVKAGRDYLKEGTLMKLCRKDMQERMFFLLTDVLLYTTPVGGNQYKLNKTLPLLGMQVLVPDSPDFVNEFSIISTTRSFTLTASTPEERDQWVEAINNAIDVVTKRKITFVSKTRDAAALGIQEQEGDFKLGEKAPVWIPDARVTMCMSCTSPFTLTNRRHHCRACGNVVCGSCSESTAPLVYLDYTQARVCDKCYDLLLKDFHTDEIHLVEEEAAALPPLLQEVENAEKLLRKPTKFEIMRRFKSRKTKRKSQIMHPSHLTEVVANQEGSQMSGYLRFKKGRHGMKKAWFVLKNNVLYSYKASSDVVALETLPVLSYEIEDLGKEGDDFVFQLKHRGVPPLVFKADNETSGTRWLQELKKAITMET